MEYKRMRPGILGQPRLIIHGGAGNITPENMSQERYLSYRDSLLTILGKTNAYLTRGPKRPSALEAATFAVRLLEDDELYNSGRGAVFTRDGTNELEASVMVSRGFRKRGVGVTGLRRVRNPILLARRMLEAGEMDLCSSSSRPRPRPGPASKGDKGDKPAVSDHMSDRHDVDDGLEANDGPPGRDASEREDPQQQQQQQQQGIDVPSAQGHTLIHGLAAEALARDLYGLEMVEPAYFFTQQRWDEHVRALRREKGDSGVTTATWSADEYLPQGTCGAVCMDGDGVVCVATSTGGMTNKLSGRIGDTPVVGAGFWAEEWEEEDEDDQEQGEEQDLGPQQQHRTRNGMPLLVEVAGAMRDVLAMCLPDARAQIYRDNYYYAPMRDHGGGGGGLKKSRSFAASGTGNGDSFMRLSAVRSVAAMARWKACPSSEAIRAMAGPGGELQRSTGDRWGHAGEGEGGMIGIEAVVERNDEGDIVGVRGEVVQAHNCGGMFRAWIDDRGRPIMKIFGNGVDEPYPSLVKEEAGCP